MHLDFRVYDFSYIPIETLSVIYEQFFPTSAASESTDASSNTPSSINRSARLRCRPEAAPGIPAWLGTSADEVILKLAFRPPYDWSQVRDFLAARAVPGVERVDAQGYAFAN